MWVTLILIYSYCVPVFSSTGFSIQYCHPSVLEGFLLASGPSSLVWVIWSAGKHSTGIAVHVIDLSETGGM